MKIVGTVRTRNEERNIANFCRGYDFADLILVADGGSEDNTIAIAQQFPKVRVMPFQNKAWSESGIWRNPEGEHINFLFDWADAEGADWILFDDCDCRPNRLLRENARRLLEGTEHFYAGAVRLYMWGVDNLRESVKGKHFRDLAQPAGQGQWEPSPWAWRGELGFRAQAENPWDTGIVPFDAPNALKILPPYCLLHFPWPTEKEVERKLAFYRNSGQIPLMLHPLEFGGELKDCPEWARE